MSASAEINLKRLENTAATLGYRLNDDASRVEKINGLMANLYDETGSWICPCKKKVPRSEGQGPICCPCPELPDEITESGHCCCRVFFSP